MLLTLLPILGIVACSSVDVLILSMAEPMNPLDIELLINHAGGITTAFLRAELPSQRRDLAEPTIIELDEDALRALSTDPDSYGRLLTNAVFVPQIRDGWLQALGLAERFSNIIQLRLTIHGRESFHALHWELLRNPIDRHPLAHNERIRFSRFLSSQSSVETQTRPMPTLRAIVAVANPASLAGLNLAPVDVAREVAQAQQSLDGISITLLDGQENRLAATMPAIAAALRDGADVLYLVCHGALIDEQPRLFLEQVGDERYQPTAGEALVQQINSLKHRPLLIVLASCQGAGDTHQTLTAVGPRLAQAGVGAVIAMQGAVPMELVAALMPRLFRELRRDGQIDRALAAARAALPATSPHWLPILWMTVRDGSLWRANADSNSYNQPQTSQDGFTERTLRVLVADNERARTEALSARDRAWARQYDHIRVEVDAGYTARVRHQTLGLVEEVQRAVDAGDVVDEALLGRIFRLGAIVLLPNRSGGDQNQSRHYLSQALRFSTGEDHAKCETIDAVLTNWELGVESALARLEMLPGQEPLRMRFSLLLESDQLTACQKLIAEEVVQLDWIEADVNWARILALYAAHMDDRDLVYRSIAQLTTATSPADHQEVAGLALTRLAYSRLTSFCRAHRIFPEFHVSLDLEALVDQDSCSRAATCFEQAGNLYQFERCPDDAARTLASALRLSMDGTSPERVMALRTRLFQLAPDHLLLSVSSIESITPSEIYAALEQACQSGRGDPDLLLRLVERLAPEDIAPDALRLLNQFWDRFTVSDVARARAAYVKMVLLQHTEGRTAAEAWLETFEIPEGYDHLRPLWHVTLLVDDAPALSVGRIREAFALAPDHPEVIAAALILARRQHQQLLQLHYAERLFLTLQTPQTATWLIRSLQEAQRWSDILAQLEQIGALLPDSTLHGSRAAALIGTDQLLAAEADLAWLSEHEQITLQGLLQLANIYQLQHRQDEATAVLRICTERFAQEPVSHVLLSDQLLTAGAHDASVEVAQRALERFPQDASVAAHLFHLGFPTGYEDEAEIGGLMQAFLPGGQFAESGFLEARPIDDLVEIVQAHRLVMQEIGEMYRTGRITLLILCYRFRRPLFYDHWFRQQHRIQRLVPIRPSEPQQGFWQVERLPQLFLDYSALLTLWSLFGRRWLAQLRPRIEQLLIPERLLHLLAWEQHDLARRGQPRWQAARIAVRDVVTSQPQLFHIEREAEQAGAIEQMPADGRLTIDDQLPDAPLPLQTIGLVALAQWLLQEGMITRPIYEQLIRGAPAARSEEIERQANLRRGCAVQIDASLLTRLAVADALDACCQYFGAIYVAEPTWLYLLAEIREFDDVQRMENELHSQREIIRQGINDGFILVLSLSPEQRFLPWRLSPQPIDDEEDDQPTQLDVAFAYTDEIIGLAHAQQAPLWTDDRWLSGLIPDRAPPIVFGTEEFLLWLVERSGDSDEPFSQYRQLIRWGYQGLSIDSNYLLWLLNQGHSTDSSVVQEAVEQYRASVTGLWDLRNSPDEWNAGVIRRAFTGYNNRVFALLMSCYEQGVEPSVVARLFRQLDLSRHLAELTGKEPLYLNDILLNIPLRQDIDASGGILIGAANRQFCGWLDRVMIESGVSSATMDETWHWTVSIYRMIVEEHRREPVADRLALSLLCLVMALPERARDILFTTKLGSWIRQRYPGNIATHNVFTGPQVNGVPLVAEYRQGQWEAAYRRALTRYLVAPTTAPITGGIATIQDAGTRPGSPFLRLREMPTEWVRTHQLDPRGAPVHYRSVLGVFHDADRKQRLAIWQIGERKLRDLRLPLDAWQKLLQELCADKPQRWRRASARAATQLLSYWRVAQEYLSEAAELGPNAVALLLPSITPEVIQGWLTMPHLSWVDASALEVWAEHTAQKLHQGARDESAVIRLREFVTVYGHSLFPESVRMRREIISWIGTLPAENTASCRTVLVELARTTTSNALKATLVLLLLELQDDAENDGRGEDQDDVGNAVRALVLELIDHDSGRSRNATRVADLLSSYLYTTWRQNENHRTWSSEALAYLSSVGAFSIVHIWQGSEHERLLVGMVAFLQSRLAYQMIHEKPAQQPLGYFRPYWGTYYNYPFAFLLSGVFNADIDRSSSITTPATRTLLLQYGAKQRVIQTVLGVQRAEQDWLSAALQPDVSEAIAVLVGQPPEGETTNWADEERYYWLICMLPEAGDTLVTREVDRLSEADDDMVDQVIAMVFIRLGAADDQAVPYLPLLLRDEVLARIQRSPECYGELMWRLSGLNATGIALPPGLHQQIETLLIEVPALDGELVTLLTVKQQAFMRFLEEGQLVSTYISWLARLAADERVPLESVRIVFQLLASVCTTLPRNVKSALLGFTTELLTLQRYALLWELRRINHECHR